MEFFVSLSFVVFAMRWQKRCTTHMIDPSLQSLSLFRCKKWDKERAMWCDDDAWLNGWFSWCFVYSWLASSLWAFDIGLVFKEKSKDFFDRLVHGTFGEFHFWRIVKIKQEEILGWGHFLVKMLSMIIMVVVQRKNLKERRRWWQKWRDVLFNKTFLWYTIKSFRQTFFHCLNVCVKVHLGQCQHRHHSSSIEIRFLLLFERRMSKFLN